MTVWANPFSLGTTEDDRPCRKLMQAPMTVWANPFTLRTTEDEKPSEPGPCWKLNDERKTGEDWSSGERRPSSSKGDDDATRSRFFPLRAPGLMMAAFSRENWPLWGSGLMMVGIACLSAFNREDRLLARAPGLLGACHSSSETGG